MQKYYKCTEVAEIYHSVAKTIQGWCRMGIFPHAIRPSKKTGWIIPESDMMINGYLRDPKEFIKKDIKKAKKR